MSTSSNVSMETSGEIEVLIHDLLLWSRPFGGATHPDVEIYLDPVTGLSFRAWRKIPANQELVRSSNRMSLSYLNAMDEGIPSCLGLERPTPQNFPRSFIEALKRDDPNVIGHFFLMQQFLMGDRSFWWPYIRLLPTPEDMEHMGIPCVWPADDLVYFHQTNIELGIKTRKKIWADNWRRGIALLKDSMFESCEGPACISHIAHDISLFTRTLYTWAASIFDSRSFQPSVTLPLELMYPDLSVEEMLHLKINVEQNRFSILFPLLDIGNHDGVDRTKWDAVPGVPYFCLRNTESIEQHSQIYNFYGSKSNTELLMAYGFMLGGAHDKVNLRVTPPLEKTLERRRKQDCHIRAAKAEEEFLYRLGPVPPVSGASETLGQLSCSPPGLLCTLSCLVANDREASYFDRNPEYCLESRQDLKSPPMHRNAITTLHALSAKLSVDISKLEYTLDTPNHRRNRNQELAMEYRRRQVKVLEGAQDRILETLNAVCRNNTFNDASEYGHIMSHPQYASSTPRCTVLAEAEIVSLECAYQWLEFKYQDIHASIVQYISGDQDIGLPLDWANLVAGKDLDHIYWIIWFFIVLVLKHKYRELPHPKLDGWLSTMTESWEAALEEDDSVEGTFYGDDRDLQKVEPMLQALYVLPELEIEDEVWSSFIFLASWIAQQETLQMPCTFQSGSEAGYEGFEQKVLIL